MSKAASLGKFAEQRAVDYLRQQNYQILARNFRWRYKEIDIIASQNKTLVIVEVKARTKLYFGAPETFVSRRKIQNLVEATNAYMDQFQIDWEVRFDVIALHFSRGSWEIKHLKNAFNAI